MLTAVVLFPFLPTISAHSHQQHPAGDDRPTKTWRHHQQLHDRSYRPWLWYIRLFAEVHDAGDVKHELNGVVNNEQTQRYPRQADNTQNIAAANHSNTTNTTKQLATHMSNITESHDSLCSGDTTFCLRWYDRQRLARQPFANGVRSAVLCNYKM